MKTPSYTGGWKSVYYSLHVVKEVGPVAFTKSLLSKNTCKTCAYGMGGQKGGMVNEEGDQIEVCKKSLQAQLTDIQPAISTNFWHKNSIEDLLNLRPRELERLGRLNDPLLKKKGDTHYKPIDWQEATALLKEKFKKVDAARTFFYSSGRSSNEAAFLLHLFARLFGTNNVNNCSYYCHQASGVGMGNTLGTGTATVQLKDVKKADLIFVIGANPASNHPRFLTELMHCRRRGGKVIIVNPAKEPGLVKFSIPSNVKSFLSSGSEIASHYYQPKIGGDMAVLYGVGKALFEKGKVDETFVNKYCEGANEYKSQLENLTWEQITQSCGLSKVELEEIADLYGIAQNVIFTWAMGITHHSHGVENVEAIVNLAMLRGMLGREHAGLLPLRGHSNVQGVGSVGVTPVLKEKIFQNMEKQLNITLPDTPGWDTMECMNQAAEGNVDLAFILGGNLYASNPNLHFAEKALSNIPFKVFLNTTLNEGHLRGIDEEVLILPVKARDEEEQKTTQESMFNYVRLSDGGIDRHNGTRSEYDIILELAKSIISKEVFDFQSFGEFRDIRKVIAKVIPGFDKLENIDEINEEFQVGGRTFHQPVFGTANGKAKFRFHPLPKGKNETNSFSLMSVRSEGQFNSIVYEEKDAWRGVEDRNTILMNPNDMQKLKVNDQDEISIRSKAGKLQMKVQAFDIKEGCVLGYYPETNFLVSSDLDPQSKTPAFKNTEVWIEKA
ncbi:FdhF/YdeP family oxidoreductase [Jiulongibacter sediminis]|uniref:Histidine kinase n=1 Tax=Jiulongibacter sediminis TaxID=1605367 RepID=A0A0P7C548_9BACT|nr:FdhF/YdeP family oxidoreductase [Jiulongibacter sediminis]KPM49465.1 histidine kinase [Jiulongibacter sediminis]TBX26513.1 histidine kinase [Jiulongibacter sediminis]